MKANTYDTGTLKVAASTNGPIGNRAGSPRKFRRYRFISLHKPVGMHAYQFIILKSFIDGIDMRNIVLNNNNVHISFAGYLLKIIFYLPMFAIKHDNIDAGAKSLKQMPRNFPITEVGAE